MIGIEVIEFLGSIVAIGITVEQEEQGYQMLNKDAEKRLVESTECHLGSLDTLEDNMNDIKKIIDAANLESEKEIMDFEDKLVDLIINVR